MKSPFALERYLADLRDRTAWAPDYPLETLTGSAVPREALYRMAHLWALALLDDRFDTLLLPILVTPDSPLHALDDSAWRLPPGYFRERLESGACIFFVDGPEAETARWPRNRAFVALQSPFTPNPHSCP